MREIGQEIKDFIVQEFMFDNPQTDLADDQPLIEEGIIDSLGIFVLIGFLDQHFGAKVQPEDIVLENFESVDAIRSLVIARQPAAVESAQ